MKLALEGKRPPYVPWNVGLTVEAREKLRQHYGQDDLEVALQNHFLRLGSDIGFFTKRVYSPGAACRPVHRWFGTRVTCQGAVHGEEQERRRGYPAEAPYLRPALTPPGPLP